MFTGLPAKTVFTTLPPFVVFAGVTIPGGKLMNSSSSFGKRSVLHVFSPHFSHTEVCATCARSNCGLLSQSRVTQIEEQPRDTSNNT